MTASENEIAEALAACRLPTDSLEEFILFAAEKNNEMFERACEEVGSDRTEASYRTSSWGFLSILKGHPEFADLPAWEAAQRADELLGPHGGWRFLPDHDVFGNECNPRDSFIQGWDAVREPLYRTPTPSQAMPLVERWPLRWSSPGFAVNTLGG